MKDTRDTIFGYAPDEMISDRNREKLKEEEHMYETSLWENGLRELPIRNEKQSDRQSIDIELTVCSQPSAHGFEAQSRNGPPCIVVYAADGWRIHGPFSTGESLRVLNTRLVENREALELMPWTEVFHR